jgi:hypothetical protein
MKTQRLLTDGQNGREWRRLFALWARRALLRAGWRISIVGDPHLDAMAEYSTVVPRREVVFKFRTDVKADSLTAAHEIGHVMVAPIQHSADHVIEDLPEAQKSLARKCIRDAIEEAAENIALALAEAYRELDADRRGGKRNGKRPKAARR